MVLKIAVVGAGVAGSFLLNRLGEEHEVECFEMRRQEKWYTVCAWGTSAPYISELIAKAGFNFEDYVLHRGRNMTVDYGTGSFEMPLRGLVSYDKHRLCEDLLKGHKVTWGAQIRSPDDGRLKDFDIVVDATGLHRTLLPKIKDDLVIPCVEYQVRSKKLPWDDFYIKPYRGLTGYFWYFPLGDGMAHIGAGDIRGSYRGELEEMLRKYDCEVVRKIGRPVRIVPPAYCQPFAAGRVVGVGESIGSVYPMLGEGIIPSMLCVEAFVEKIPDIEGYSEEVLKRFDIYSRVYRFVRSKIDGDFSIARNFAELLSIYLHMKSNTKRYGIETRLGDMLKIAKA